VSARVTPTRALAALAVVATCAVATARAASTSALEARAQAFYELLERGQKERAAAEFPGLEHDLSSTLDALDDRLEKLRDDVVDRDGDLEALYASPEWRDPEVQSLVLSYHLAWVRYQGAQLVTDAARKKKLLQEAVDGFSKFTIVNEVPEVYAESLYGRGLAFMDLNELGKAADDIAAAAQDTHTAAKAKAALAEVKRRQAGGKAAPAPDDPEVLAGKLKDLLAKPPADAAAAKPITELARGLAARKGPWPARIEALVADTMGHGKPTSVESSYGLWLLGQLAVDRGRCADVAPLAAAGDAVHDAGRATWRPELLFLDAGCKLNAGQRRAAADEYGALLDGFPKSERAQEAAYYRFRALDLARVDDPALEPALADALHEYLQRWPKAEQAVEARFVLAELERAHGDCGRAAADYAQVTSGPYATKARLGALECRVAKLSDETPEAERAQLAKDLAAFVQATPAKGADEALVARAALMGALVAAGERPPDHATVLALTSDFATRYPHATDLQPRAAQARLAARVATDRLADAGADLDAVLAAGTTREQRRTLSAIGHELTARAEHAPPGERAQALALARKLYGALAADGTTEDRIVLAGLELQAGDPARARSLYDDVLHATPDSAEALRGAARAAAAGDDVDAALGYWRRVVDSSPPGGTAWFEARIAQVELLAGHGRKPEACQVLRSSLGRAASTGGDVLEKRLAELRPQVCGS
jgi:TolA-binding protein